MSVYLLATLDTKGTEAAFVRDRLLEAGVDVMVVDCGCIGEPPFEADYIPRDVFARAGTTHNEMRAQGDRGTAVTMAAKGAAMLVLDAYDDGQLEGVIALGGSAGTTIGTAAMRELPIGIPKLMISTLASGDVSHWVGAKDILMMNSVVDVSGINRISRLILANAAAAIAGMLQKGSIIQHELWRQSNEKPLICASMFGVTTPCVQHASRILEEAGYEVLVFHATGGGGRAMESLIAEGLIAGVLDITTTELADELVGGILSAGPDRLTAAAKHGVPQVVSVGATDMVNFGPRETVPELFADRKFHIHNATVTLMRTTAEECAALGKEIAEKVSASNGPAAILLPRKGVSAIDCEGQPFDDPAARDALFEALRINRKHVELIELDQHINDAKFAETAAHKLLQLLSSQPAAT